MFEFFSIILLEFEGEQFGGMLFGAMWIELYLDCVTLVKAVWSYLLRGAMVLWT